MSIDVKKLIAAARADFAEAEPVDVPDVTLGGEKLTLRFMPIAGTEWVEITSKHPARPGVAQDIMTGHNMAATLPDFPKVHLVSDDESTQDVSEDWPEMCKVLSAKDLRKISALLWYEYDRDEAGIAAAGKASAGAKRKKRSSPANSESPSAS
jgi:hypothetical protein